MTEPKPFSLLNLRQEHLSILLQHHKEARGGFENRELLADI
jgi:hypothetical protein